MSLSSLIVQRQVATMRQVEEALARQVIYGGDLVTNVLEVALVDEAVLVDLLAASLDLPPAPAGELPRPSDEARALVSPELAAQLVVVPLAIRDKTLVLAVADRLPPEALQQLSNAAGMSLEPRAAPAVRVWQAVAETYGTKLERRMQRLLGRLAGEEWATARSLAPPISSRAPENAVTREPPAPVATVPLPRTGVAGAASMRPGPRRHSTLKSFPTERPAAGEVPVPDPSTTVTTPAPGGVRERASERPARPPGPPPKPGQRRRGPLLLDDAAAEAEQASDRDALLGLAFDFARQFFEYTALFLVHGDIAEGRDGFGSGATRERVLGIGVPLDLPSLLSRAREARFIIVATGAADGLDGVLLADLQRPLDVEVAVVPVVVRTRTVALLVGDCGDGGIDRAALRQIGELCGIVSKAFERIIVRRKLEGFVAGHRTASSGRIDVGLVPSKRPTAPMVQTPPPLPMPSPAPPPVNMRPRSSAPPPVNVATVRQISGPPIPREEPTSEGKVAAAERRRGSIPPRPRKSIAPAARGSNGPQRGSVAPARRGSIAPGPTRGGSVVATPDDEVGVLIDRLRMFGVDPNAEAEIARLPDRSLALLMARFPGPVRLPRHEAVAMVPPPPAGECGPLLGLVVRVKKRALPYLLQWLGDPDPDKRGWAAYVLSEIPALEALPALAVALDDPGDAVRAAAKLAVESLESTFGKAVVGAMRRFGHEASTEDRVKDLRIMGDSREPAVVPGLIRALDDEDERVASAARDALVAVTRQDFDNERSAWIEWWDANGARHRIEWLIDALVHSAPQIRQAAGDELRTQSRQYFGYASDMPPRDRERAQRRYRDWWITEGRNRLMRP